MGGKKTGFAAFRTASWTPFTGSNGEDLSRRESFDGPGEDSGGQYVRQESLHLDDSRLGYLIGPYH